MGLRLVTPPASSIVTLAEAKKHLNVFHPDDDDYIELLTSVAQDWLAGENAWLGRAVVGSTWELTASAFPAGQIDLPKPPLIALVGVFYTPPSGGAEVELAGVRVIDAGASFGGYLLPAKGSSWPQTDGEPGSVRIRFTAGYDAVPPSIKHAALLMIGHWYEHREAATEIDVKDLPMAVDALLYPYRNWPV